MKPLILHHRIAMPDAEATVSARKRLPPATAAGIAFAALCLAAAGAALLQPAVDAPMAAVAARAQAGQQAVAPPAAQPGGMEPASQQAGAEPDAGPRRRTGCKRPLGVALSEDIYDGPEEDDAPAPDR